MNVVVTSALMDFEELFIEVYQRVGDFHMIVEEHRGAVMYRIRWLSKRLQHFREVQSSTPERSLQLILELESTQL